MAKSKKSNRRIPKTKPTRVPFQRRKGLITNRREKKLPHAQDDPVIRAIVASARYLGIDNPLLFGAIRWCIAQQLYLDAVYGSDKIVRECMGPWHKGCKSRDEHIQAVIKKHGFNDDIDLFLATRQSVHRRVKQVHKPVKVDSVSEVDLSVMKPILQHLKSESAGDVREPSRESGALLDWYV
jgi:hypothetical protein